MRLEIHHYHHGSGDARDLDHFLSALQAMESHIMSAISDFAAKQTAFNTELASDLTDLSTKIDALNAQITALQNSSGTVSPEDQALIDDLQAKGLALVGQADALAGKQPPTPPAA